MKKILSFYFLYFGLTINVLSQNLSLIPLDTSSNFSDPIDAIKFNDQFYLGLSDGIHGNEIFIFKDDKIELLKDIKKGFWGSYATNFIVYKQKLLFTADDKLYSYDDLKNEIEVVANNLKNINDFIEFENKLYFNAFQSGSGYELWSTNGDSVGTTLIKDIYKGGKLTDYFQYEVNSSYPNNFLTYENDLLFLARNEEGYNIWTTKGSDNDTEIKVKLKYGAISMLVFNNKIFLLVPNNNSNELWTTDGTDANTVLFKRIGGNFGGIKHYLLSITISFSFLQMIVYMVENYGSQMVL